MESHDSSESSAYGIVLLNFRDRIGGLTFRFGWVWADQADSIKHVGVCPVVLAILSICLTSHHMNVASPWSVNCHTERQNEFGDCYLNGAPPPKILINPR